MASEQAMNAGFDLPLDVFRAIAEFCGMSSLLAAGCTSFVLCSFIYTISGTASRLLSKTYSKLAIKDQHRWNSGLNRSSMGFLLALIGFRVLWEGPPADIVSGTTDLLTHTASFALGFFVFETRDSLNMYLAHDVREEPVIIHHVLGVFLYFLTLHWRAYLYFSCVVLVQEIQSPFTHIGWILAKQGRDTHWLWDLNQYALIFLWVVCRNCLDVMIWIRVIANLPNFITGPLLPMLYILVGMTLLSVYLNPWWLKLKVLQIKRRNERLLRQAAGADPRVALSRANSHDSPADKAADRDREPKQQQHQHQD